MIKQQEMLLVQGAQGPALPNQECPSFVPPAVLQRSSSMVRTSAQQEAFLAQNTPVPFQGTLPAAAQTASTVQFPMRSSASTIRSSTKQDRLDCSASTIRGSMKQDRL